MKISHLLLVLLPALFLTSCGGGYKTDVPPPSGKETYKEILPAEIGGVAVDGKKLELDASRYQGVAASYGAGAKLTVLQCKDQAALDEYVKGTVVPGLEEFGSRSSGKFNGVWSLKGSGKTGRIYGWQNGNWLFVIQASNDELFDEVVDKFAYISKE